MASPKRILFSACDAGTANYLVPLLPEIQQEYVIYCQPPAAAILKKAGFSCTELPRANDWQALLAQGLAVFAKEKVDLAVLGTSWGPTLDKALTLAAREQGTRTIALIEHWALYRERFSQVEQGRMSDELLYLPDEVWINDDVAKSQAVAAGLPGNKLREMGQPHLERKLDALKQKERDPHGNQIVFISERIQEDFVAGSELDVGFNEFRTLDMLLSAIDFDRYELVIKLHPQELPDKYAKKVAAHSRVKVVAQCDLDRLLLEAHKVVGMGSMVLLEAALVRSDVLSIMPGGRPELFIGNVVGATRFIPTASELATELSKPPLENSRSEFGARFAGSKTRIITKLNEELS